MTQGYDDGLVRRIMVCSVCEYREKSYPDCGYRFRWCWWNRFKVNKWNH